MIAGVVWGAIAIIGFVALLFAFIVIVSGSYLIPIIIFATGIFIWLFTWWMIFISTPDSVVIKGSAWMSFRQFKDIYFIKKDRFEYTDECNSLFNRLVYRIQIDHWGTHSKAIHIKFHFIAFLRFKLWLLFKLNETKPIDTGLEQVLLTAQKDIEEFRAKNPVLQNKKQIKLKEKTNNISYDTSNNQGGAGRSCSYIGYIQLDDKCYWNPKTNSIVVLHQEVR